MEAETGNATRAASAGKAKRRASSKSSRRSKQPRRSSGNGETQLAPMDTAMREGTRFMKKAYRWADDMGRAVPKMARGLHLPSTASLNRFAEANPIVLGAVGLGIGVAIGAMLPHISKASNGNGRQGTRSRAGRKRAAH